jgi:hypothetical protein
MTPYGRDKDMSAEKSSDTLPEVPLPSPSSCHTTGILTNEETEVEGAPTPVF